MLLYRYAKMMEEHSRTKSGSMTGAEATDRGLAELMQMREKMTGELTGYMEEDCSDWAAEATY